VNVGVATEPPRLRSELETPRERRDRRVAWGLAIFAVLLVGVPAIALLYLMPIFGNDVPPQARAAWKVKTLAHEDFPRWQKLHPDRLCPARLSELDDISTLDPWGHALQYTCDPRLLRAASPGIAITSAGEDGTFGTADDIGSEP
jgi:hypothetical protein